MDNTILSNIKQALSHSAVTEKTCDMSNGRLIEKDLSLDEKISLFETRAQSSGSNVHTAKGVTQLRDCLKQIIPAGSTVMASMLEDSVAKFGRIKDLVPAGSTCLGDQPLDKDELFNTDIAITDVSVAVAETGSVMICPDKTQRRMKSLVCTKHIALITSDQICSDLMDISKYLKGLYPESMPGGFNLISGPSKTADIELQLVIGVHGPSELHLVIVK